MSEQGIRVELSKTQVERIVREAGEHEGVLSVLQEIDREWSPGSVQDRRLSHSLLRGLMVLACFPAEGTARSVRSVARELNLGVTTTRRYISTLVEVGLLERDAASRRYRLTGEE